MNKPKDQATAALCARHCSSALKRIADGLEKRHELERVEGLSKAVGACGACGKTFNDHGGVVLTCRKVLLLKAAIEAIDDLANDSPCEDPVIGKILGMTWRALKELESM